MYYDLQSNKLRVLRRGRHDKRGARHAAVAEHRRCSIHDGEICGALGSTE